MADFASVRSGGREDVNALESFRGGNFVPLTAR